MGNECGCSGDDACAAGLVWDTLNESSQNALSARLQKGVAVTGLPLYLTHMQGVRGYVPACAAWGPMLYCA